MTQKRFAPASAMEVANWFIERAKKDTNVPPLDQLKLYKLVYYAHAFHLGNGKGPLFEEDIEAWPFGPVVRNLYIEFKDAGRGPIRKLGRAIDINDYSLKAPIYEGELEQYLDQIWQTYSKYSGIRLSNATHAEGEPWTIVAKSIDLCEKPTIPNELIEQVYARKIQKSQKS